MSNLSPEEQFRLTGVVTGDNLTALLDAGLAIEEMESAESEIQEAIGCLPDEDFLSEEVLELDEWAKSKRGQNKAEFLDLISRIRVKLQEQQQQAEYGMEKLESAKNLLVL